MKNTKIAKMASMLLAGASLLTLGLTACTASETPSEAPPTASPKVTAAADAPNAEKAAAVVVNYADGVKEKDPQQVCDNLDQRVITLTIDAIDPQTDGSTSPKSCTDVFTEVLNNAETNTVISETVDVKGIASKATEISPTLYSFPASTISADATSNVFVGEIDGAWKITFDPAEEEVVKQIEADKAKPKTSPTPAATTPAP